jgi:hypothetical protein
VGGFVNIHSQNVTNGLFCGVLRYQPQTNLLCGFSDTYSPAMLTNRDRLGCQRAGRGERSCVTPRSVSVESHSLRIVESYPEKINRRQICTRSAPDLSTPSPYTQNLPNRSTFDLDSKSLRGEFSWTKSARYKDQSWSFLVRRLGKSSMAFQWSFSIFHYADVNLTECESCGILRSSDRIDRLIVNILAYFDTAVYAIIGVSQIK